RRLDLCRAPRELNVHRYVLPRKIVARDTDELCGNGSTVKITSGLERGILGYGEHPADPAEALLGVDKLGDTRQHTSRAVAQLVFCNPVLPCKTRIEHAVGDISSHLLGADQHAVDLRIIDGGEVGSGVDEDVESSPGEQLDRRLLQRSFRNSEFELHNGASA